MTEPRPIEVQCVGGACDGLTVKLLPAPVYYEVVDPRDRLVRDFYAFEVIDGKPQLTVQP